MLLPAPSPLRPLAGAIAVAGLKRAPRSQRSGLDLEARMDEAAIGRFALSLLSPRFFFPSCFECVRRQSPSTPTPPSPPHKKKLSLPLCALAENATTTTNQPRFKMVSCSFLLSHERKGRNKKKRKRRRENLDLETLSLSLSFSLFSPPRSLLNFYRGRHALACAASALAAAAPSSSSCAAAPSRFAPSPEPCCLPLLLSCRG